MTYIIGIGIEGKESLSKKILKLIENASILIGGRRHLAYFPEFKGKRIVIGSDLNKIIKVLTPHSSLLTPHYAVVLATGDPNFFGIADFILKRFGKDTIEIIPNASTMQEAFARIKENWNDARFLSVHGRGKVRSLSPQALSGDQKSEVRGQKDIIDEISAYNKVGIFTDPQNTPSKIAKALLDKGIKDYTAYICEDLGTDRERITKGTLSLISKKDFSPLNVMILMRSQESGVRSQKEKAVYASHPRYKHSGAGITPDTNIRGQAYHGSFGIPDSSFSHPNGMLTKEEIRIISLSKLKLKQNSIVWDIGAGCGSVSIESALLAKQGKVFAVEKDRKMITCIEKNKKRFNVKNMEVINGVAPSVLKGMPSPDAVFIGGGGKDIDRIIDVCAKRLKQGGRMVINAITIETLSTAAKSFKGLKWNTEVTSVNIAKTKPVPACLQQGDVADLHLFNAHNPVFIIVGEKNQ
ncbi:MAG: precorrin-6y C5,15-methyltransferase (decarboxylating) subunit CbiE [Deltaproteobacteria bacterium]|nr:precorrin-6y C5,15-methyltransferase (decarboxylating) subunit CbiE [Deltaproteobacteria bacterium]